MASSNAAPSNIRIFIGEPIQNRSEHECLRAVHDALTRTGEWGYIFTNFHVAGRQIDLAIFTERLTLVIEVKGYALPIIGEINGQWDQLGPYGTKKIGNAYLQALNAKNALRDEIARIAQINGYPNGLVAVAPGIPPQSRVTAGDFKVSVVGLGQVNTALANSSGALLSQVNCSLLASRLGLEEISGIDAAIFDDILAAGRSLTAYAKAFCDLHAPIAAELVIDQYKHDDKPILQSQIQLQIEAGAAAMLIQGPSGCGKTLLATSCAVSAAETGHIPIIVSAKDYDGEFARLLDKEITLLNATASKTVLNAGKRLGKRIMLFLDGYNECKDEFKLRLTRSLKAFSRRYDAAIVVSTQGALTRGDLLMTQTIVIDRPSEEFKAILAKTAEQPSRLGESLNHLLLAANSGLEASLVGKVGGLVQIGASKFALFDTYARTKLGTAAPSGIRLLSSLAEALVRRASFSISIREFDRLCDSVNLGDSARDQIARSRLLQIRADRVSFIHELFFSAFSAEAVVRAANGERSRIEDALRSPRLSSAKIFLMGAIEDAQVAHQILADTFDGELLSASMQGICGADAQSIARKRIERSLNLMISEAQKICFQVIGESRNGASIDDTSIDHGIKGFEADLMAITRELVDGRCFPEVLKACECMDEAIADFLTAAQSDGPIKKASVRSAAFSAAYVMGREAAISRLVNFIHSGGLFRQKEGERFRDALRAGWSNAKTAGQFYFLIGLTKFSGRKNEFAQKISRLLKEVRNYPYHLQLDLFDIAGHFSEAEEPYRSAIVDSLEASLDKSGAMMNSIIVEALVRLGALEEEENQHLDTIRVEIETALNGDGPTYDQMAYGLFTCQFDHPFDSSYWQEIQNLDPARKLALLAKACRGAELPHLSFLGILIRQLADFGDPSVSDVIEKWTALPDKKHFMPQEALDVFVTAHESLGYLGADLPKSQELVATAVETAMLACGELFYFSNRVDIPRHQLSDLTIGPRSILLDHSKHVSAGTLYLVISRSIGETRRSFLECYPDLCLEICRGALPQWEHQISFFDHFRADPIGIARFCILALGNLGSTEDLLSLRDLCDHENFGANALEAIKLIEDRARPDQDG